MEHAQPEDQDLLPEIVLDESAEGFVPDHDPPVPVEPELGPISRGLAARLKPALAPLYKAASAVSAGSYRRRSVASAAAAAEPRSRTGRW